MQHILFDEVSLDRLGGRRRLPFRLGGKPCSGPTCKGVGFEEADMTHRSVLCEGLQARECKDLPHAVAPLPIGRCLPSLLAQHCPTVGEPPIGLLVATRLEEGDKLPLRHRSRRQLEGGDELTVPRAFVVVVEARPGVAERAQILLEPVPAQRCVTGAGIGSGLGEVLPIRRPQRTLRQQMLHVAEDQLLMLLLVLQPEFDDFEGLGGGRGTRDPRVDGSIDVAAIVTHAIERGAREQPASRPWVLLADRVVVRVEEHAERGIERGEIRLHRLEDECLEEPGGVAQMPLHRTGVGHRLHDAVLRRQRSGEALGRRAHRTIATAQGAGVESAGARRPGCGRRRHPAVHHPLATRLTVGLEPGLGLGLGLDGGIHVGFVGIDLA